MNNTMNSIWEWSQVFPMATIHPLGHVYGGGLHYHAPVLAV